MFVIVAYDVNKKRDAKILKICKKYLLHTQKSVFEGNIQDSKLNKLKEELLSIIDTNEDSIVIYQSSNPIFLSKLSVGMVPVSSNVI